MAETARTPVPTPLATTPVTIGTTMTLVIGVSAVYGITATPPSGQTLVTWSIYNRGTGSCSLRWDGVSDAVYNDPGSFVLPNGANVLGIQASRVTAAADATGCTLAIFVAPPAYR